uniref:Uncharacterized protein n=1 Tax=Trichogramma kaykai TaxID=54128 RepID=A0ABD2WKY7_9HYME
MAATEIDEWLFGKDLSEKLKHPKVTGQDVSTLAKKVSAQNYSKNRKSPPRYLNKKTTISASGQKDQASSSKSNRVKNQYNTTPRRSTTYKSGQSNQGYHKNHYSRKN